MEKILATIYLSVIFFVAMLYLVFSFRDAIDRMKARKRMSIARASEKPPEPAIDVVGKTTTVFLSPLHEPVISKQEPESAVETEPEILPADVEVIINRPPDMNDVELDDYQNVNMDEADDLSQGLTFEQIGHAVEVIEGRKSGESDEYFAGETLTLMPSDFLSVICMQADYEAMVKKLIAGYFDFPCTMKPIPAQIANFDINNYV